jgi:hypothetical protein
MNAGREEGMAISTSRMIEGARTHEGGVPAVDKFREIIVEYFGRPELLSADSENLAFRAFTHTLSGSVA